MKSIDYILWNHEGRIRESIARPQMWGFTDEEMDDAMALMHVSRQCEGVKFNEKIELPFLDIKREFLFR